MESYDSPRLIKQRLAKRLADRGARSEFCRKTGIPRSGLERWIDLEDPAAPKLENLDKIAKGLGCQPWELLKPEDASSVSPSEPSLLELRERLERIENLLKK